MRNGCVGLSHHFMDRTAGVVNTREEYSKMRATAWWKG
ncbi:MAG: hypothetical protein OJF47_003127 [Nitrospira sp.]|nr:MAG: hypothetical protein OJF47_003127 [Nitrospira sp.]